MKYKLNNILFEDVEEYFDNKDNEIIEYLNTEPNFDFIKIIDYTIEDLKNCINGNNNRKLGDGDIQFIVLLTLKIIYLLVADKFKDIDTFAIMWASLYKNYFLALDEPIENMDYLNGLINLLELKNNMARMIALSGYIIENKENDYMTVSTDYINTILERDLDIEKEPE